MFFNILLEAWIELFYLFTCYYHLIYYLNVIINIQGF